MDKLIFPNASEFSPNVIDLITLLEMCKMNEENTETFLREVKRTFFSRYADDSQDQLTNNCRAALVAYGIINKGEIKLTEVGEELHSKKTNSELLYSRFAKHILLNLNGLTLINIIKDMTKSSEKVTNENIIVRLNSLGCSISKSSKKINTMKTWLAKAEVFEGKTWRINQAKVDELTGMTEAELDCLRDLTAEQICFIKALNNTGVRTEQNASDIRNLSTATYNTIFSEKSFASSVLKPLEDKGLITVTKTTSGRGAKPSLVKPTPKMLSEITVPYLQQLEKITSSKLAEYFQLPMKDILKRIKSTNKYIKGIALEALAFKLMRIIGMQYVTTRLRSSETGGAEIDLIFDSTTLMYSRWQIQCKNSTTVDLDAVAKEVGLTHMIKSNAIVMVGTGTIGAVARQYANKVMKDSNLCIIMIDGKDLKKISENPSAIIDVFNRESQNAKSIKILEVK